MSSKNTNKSHFSSASNTIISGSQQNAQQSQQVEVQNLPEIVKLEATTQKEVVVLKLKSKCQQYLSVITNIDVKFDSFLSDLDKKVEQLNNKYGDTWLKGEIITLMRQHCNCEIMEFDNWMDIEKDINGLYNNINKQPHFFINSFKELLKTIGKGFFKYLDSKSENNGLKQTTEKKDEDSNEKLENENDLICEHLFYRRKQANNKKNLGGTVNDIIDEKAEEELKSKMI